MPPILYFIGTAALVVLLSFTIPALFSTSSHSDILVVMPYICTLYDRYRSHLSTKTPYLYRHLAFPLAHCDPHISPSTIEHCTGPTCPLQLSATLARSTLEQYHTKFASSADHPNKPIQCKLKHITHVNRHGTRMPTKAGQIDKTRDFLNEALKHDGLQLPIASDAAAHGLSQWIDAQPDSGAMDLIFAPENGGELSPLGRIELYGIGQRLREKMNWAEFSPSQLLSSSTFKKRTLQSLLALLCGLGLYDIDSSVTNAHANQSHHHHHHQSHPVVHPILSSKLLASQNLTAILNNYEHQFIEQIALSYPLDNFPAHTALPVSIVTNAYTMTLSIPPESTAEGVSPLIGLIKQHGFTPITVADYNNHIHTHHNASSQTTIQPPSPYPGRFPDVPESCLSPSQCASTLPDDLSTLDPADFDSPFFAYQWDNAKLRYFDVCAKYHAETSKQPEIWKPFLSKYTLSICGDGTHCDDIINRIFTPQYRSKYIFYNGRMEQFVTFIRTALAAQLNDPNEVDFNALAEHLKFVDYNALAVEILRNDSGNTHDKPNREQIVSTAAWLTKLASVITSPDVGKKPKKVKVAAISKKKDKDPDAKKFILPAPAHFLVTPIVIKTISAAFIQTVHNHSKATDSAKFINSQLEFGQDIQQIDAKAKLGYIKKIYGLCSLQMSVHSSPFDHYYSPTTTTKYSENQSYLDEFATYPSYVTQFCQLLGEKRPQTGNRDTNVELAATLPQWGSDMFYHLEYLTDIAQLAKKGAFTQITLASACPLLETLLPERDITTPTSLKVFGAHAETILPLLALLTGDAQPTPPPTPPIIPPNTTNLQSTLDQSYHTIYSVPNQHDDNINPTSSPLLKGLYDLSVKLTPSSQSGWGSDYAPTIGGWRSSFHTPMGANVAVHVYECESAIPTSKSPTELYAQLLLNEEVIPWPVSVGKNGSSYLGSFTRYISSDPTSQQHHHPPSSNTVFPQPLAPSTHTDSDLQQTVLVPELQRYDAVKQYFYSRYEQLGVGKCSVQDWALACHVPGAIGESNGADDD